MSQSARQTRPRDRDVYGLLLGDGCGRLAAARRPAIRRTLAHGRVHPTQTVSYSPLERISTMAVCRAADDGRGGRLAGADWRAGIDSPARGTPCLGAGIAAANFAIRDAEPRSCRGTGRVSQVAGETRRRRRPGGVGKLERRAAEAVPPARPGQARLALYTPE